MHLFMAAEFTNVCKEFCFELVTTETKCNENPWIANHEFHYHKVLKQYSLTHSILQIQLCCPRSKWNMGEILAFLA